MNTYKFCYDTNYNQFECEIHATTFNEAARIFMKNHRKNLMQVIDVEENGKSITDIMRMIWYKF